MFRQGPILIALPLLTFLPMPVRAQPVHRDESAALEFFEKRIRPLLVDNCFTCHSANTNSKGGLRVDDRNGMLVGGQSGPAIVPGHPEKSQIIKRVNHTDDNMRMPLRKQLTPEQIADLTRWIKDGAAWPRVNVPASIGRPNLKYEKLRKEHWAWQQLKEPKVPAVRDATWVRGDVDRFVLAALEAKGLAPVPDADPVSLLRRVTFDLTGLPPTLEEMDAFLKDCAGAKPHAAFEKVVDRLLASPRFGERWGRHWLDLARYGESTGSARNLPYPHAWRYRDYVIDAFNADVPYDRFIQEQIAGDLLPAKTQRERDRQLVATGFLAIGVCDVNQRFKVRFIMDNIDEQIDTVTRSVLALTASCARCHDHKFDPIPTTEYYALAGIFHSSDRCAGLRNKMGGGGLDYYDTTLLLPLGVRNGPDPLLAAKVAKATAALEQARKDLQAISENLDKNPPGPEREKNLTVARQRIKKVQAELIALNDPATSGPVCMGARDATVVGDTEIRIRGEAEKLGPTVPRGFLSLVNMPDAPKINPNQSGRLELAQWLTSTKNPLTPRVMANRVWHHLFGQGIVPSVDNFGVTGEKPSHPELLDHLAVQFASPLLEGEGPGVRGVGWSIKKLIRTIVLSRAYQLGSEAPAANLAADPANRLVWRHNPRRLSAEEIRDAMLAASGKLILTPPKGSPAMELKVIELTNVSPLAKQLEDEAKKSVQRSVYLPLVRLVTPRSLDVFDFAEQGLVTGSRDTTTVATQALYLLNDPFVRQQAQSVASRVLQQKDLDDASRIALVYRFTLSRPATAKEIERGQSYVTDYEAAVREEGTKDARTVAWASFCQAVLASAEFRYVK